jgi:hypothetical protein
MEKISDALSYVLMGILFAGIMVLLVALLITTIRELKVLNKASDSKKIDNAEKRKGLTPS